MEDEIKFMAWDGLNEKFTYWTINDLCTWDNKDEKPSALDNWIEFTNQQDVNKKDIYDGFIMETPEGERYEVKKDWYLTSCSYKYEEILVNGYKNMSNDKIIGNKFEDKELLNNK